MAGIYIHIPFCKQKCNYCDFYSSAGFANKSAVLSAIAVELEQRALFLGDNKIDTIYLGGGTPSICTATEIGELLAKIASVWGDSSPTEITLEANPEDLSSEYLSQLREVGVNRLSIGVQSFVDEHLTAMNRRHNAHRAIDAVGDAKSVGFDNISIDLIYGLPQMSIEQWGRNIEQALELEVAHISAYHLTIESMTVFGKMLKKGTLTQIPEAQSEEQFLLLNRMLTEAGYEHYEVSNFAKPGMRSRHNSSYWNGVPYLGVGPAAHSFNGNVRQWNVNSNRLYLEKLPHAEQYEQEILTVDDQYNEYVMTSLRTDRGVSIECIESRFGARKLQYFINAIERFVEKGNVTCVEGRYFIPTHKYLMSDYIISQLFWC